MTTAEQIEYICKKARAAGMTYGQYVARYGSSMEIPNDLREYKICKTCKTPFLPNMLKSGQRKSGHV